MRNVDSKIHSSRFELLRIFTRKLLPTDFCNKIGHTGNSVGLPVGHRPPDRDAPVWVGCDAVLEPVRAHADQSSIPPARLGDLRDPAGPLRSPRSDTDTALSDRNVLNSAGVGINHHLYREPIDVLIDTVGKGVANI